MLRKMYTDGMFRCNLTARCLHTMVSATAKQIPVALVIVEHEMVFEVENPLFQSETTNTELRFQEKTRNQRESV